MKVRVVAAAAALAVAVLAAGLTLAQVAQPPAGEAKQVEGTVRNVDLLERAIEVDGHAGLFPRRVVIVSEARVTMPSGRVDSITAIREGDRVLATYRQVGDQLVADEVMVLYSQEELVEAPVRAAPR